MLSDIDIDVVLQVLAWLHAEDILSLRKTSKYFNSITHLRTVWHNALINVLADNIPIARVPLGLDDSERRALRDFSSLSAPDLEQLVLATCRTNEIWEQERPVRTRATRMRARVGRVFMLRFLRICSSLGGNDEDVDEGRYLLSFGHTAIPTLCMQVWDVDASGEGQNGERLVAEWSVSGRVIGVAVDEGNGLHEWALNNSEGTSANGALIAVSARCFDIPGEVFFAFRILHFTPSSPFIGSLSILKSFRLRGPLNVRAMHGRLVAVQVRANGEGQAFGHGVLKVVDWVRSTEIFAQEDFRSSVTGISDSGREVAAKLEPSVHGMNRAVLGVHFVHDWILVFRESVVEMYFLPPSSLGRPQTLLPRAVHKWNWQINSLAVTERVSWVHDFTATRCTLCDGQGFVPVCAAADQNSEDEGRRIVCTCRYRPLSIAVRFDSYYPWPVNLLHHFVLHPNPNQSPLHFGPPVAPYIFPPALIHTVPSTVRLFGHSVLVLGRFGTLLWTDSEANGSEGSADAEAYFAEGTGERVAGRRLPLPPRPKHTTFPDPLVTRQQDTGPSGTDPPPVVAQPDATVGQTMQTSLFATRSSEGWYSVALCESRGRIAVGDGEGVIELWDHF